MRGDSDEIRQALTDFRAGVDVETSFRALFDRYYPWVLKRALKEVAWEASEDLVQEVFKGVFESRRKCPPEVEDFEPWLFGIARNKLRQRREYWRRQRRRGTHVPVEHLEVPNGPARGPGKGPALEDLLSKEVREVLNEAIRALPPQQRRCLLLRLSQGRTIAVIARTLRLSEGTVKSHLHDAKTNLRAKLGKRFAETGEDH